MRWIWTVWGLWGCAGANGGPAGSSPEGSPEDSAGFVEASGTAAGREVEVSCRAEEPDELAMTQARDGDQRYVTAACLDQNGESGISISLGAFTPEATSSEVCDLEGLSAQVVDLTTGLFWNCAVDSAAGFQMTLDSFVTEADGSITWAGDFVLTGGEMGLAVDLAGTFRVNSPCNGAGC
jgi:hypothetical protein